MNRTRTIVLATVVVLFFASAARADSVDVELTQTSQTAAPGSTITFDATITNLSSTDTVFLNGDGSITSSPLLTVDDTPFLTNFPLSLDPSETSGPFALLNVIDFNSFSILGGADGSASDTIGTAEFSVTVATASPVPEPGILGLLVVGLLGLGALGSLRQRFSS